MLTNNEMDLKSLFQRGFHENAYTRLKHFHDLRIYIGADEKGFYAFKLMGRFTPERISSSNVIKVQQTKIGEDYSLIFSLELPDMLEYFCAFCTDLISSIQDIKSCSEAYSEMTSRYFSWKKMFRTQQNRFSEKEIMGLLAELLFLKDRLIPRVGLTTAIQAWTGPEKLHKDFSIDGKWYEIKAISSGKDSVRISSLEQLDSLTDGVLSVYRFEKMSPAFSGLKLNQVVIDILNQLSHAQVYEMFMSKLELVGYTWTADYDNFVFNIIESIDFNVTDGFPRLRRSDIPLAITQIQYDILLPEIEEYKSIKS